jgi:hypothetical protein
MKKINLIAVIALFTSVAGVAQKKDVVVSHPQKDTVTSTYNAVTSRFINNLSAQLSEQEGVTSITVTKALLDMIPEIHSHIEENGMNIKQVISKLEHINVFISVDNPAAANMMKNINKQIISQSFIDILLNIKKTQNNVTFYGEKSFMSPNSYHSFIMFMESEMKCVLIRLVGKFNKTEIEEIIKLNKESKK